MPEDYAIGQLATVKHSQWKIQEDYGNVTGHGITVWEASRVEL